MRLFSIACLGAVIVACAEPAVNTSEPDWHWDEAVTAPSTMFLSEMTSGEIGARQRDGATDVIVPIGGLEQNGPFVVTAKHDIVVTHLAGVIAERRGNTLVAETVSFVPQGNFAPPSAHLRYPGTVGVSEETYRQLLADIVQSLKITGFKRIFLIGDSGGNQHGMHEIAKQQQNVYSITEYYSEDPLDRAFLKSRDIQEQGSSIHTSYRHEAILAAIDPSTIRHASRQDQQLTTNGVPIADLPALQAIGRELIEYRADLTVEAMERAVNEDYLAAAH